MKMTRKVACLLFAVILISGGCFAQTDSNNKAINNNAPDTLLEYRLSQNQFLYYYGNDDTARALINMFFRKRNFFSLGGSPSENVCWGVGLIVITDGVAVTVLGIRAAINCTIYNRQRLLYALLDRENGYPLPTDLVNKLKAVDFRY
jgi:hypothetical protein